MNKTAEIDLSAIFNALLRKLWLIVLCAAIAGTAAWGYTTYFITPMYQASVSIYVNNKNITTNTVGISASDLATSQKLVDTYVTIIESESVLTKVAEEVGGSMTASRIRSMMSAEAVGETEVFKVKISNANPELAAKIANAVASVAPNEISNIVTGSTTKIIDYAKTPTAPYSPSLYKNLLMGVVSGIALAAVIIVLQVLLDFRVKSEQDLAALSDAPILGLIPDFGLEEKKGSGYEKQTDQESEEKAVEK